MNETKSRSVKGLYLQILFVIFVFVLMVVSCYFFARNVERGHLEDQTEITFSNIESMLNADLKEFETMLGVVSETIRGMLLMNYDLDVVKKYMTDMTDYKKNDEQSPGFFGFFAGFGEDGMNGFNALTPDVDWDEIIASGYNPKERPWYKAAELSGNDIVITEPYVDEVSKEVTFTYVRNIYDNNGKRLAIVCLDVLLSRIYKFSIENRNNDISFWVLHDKNHIVTAHPNTDFVGRQFRNVDSGFAVLADELEREGFVSNRSGRDYLGRQALFTMKQLENGWFLGIVTQTEIYYSNLRFIFWYLIALGSLLAAGLILILIRINSAKEKSEKRAQEAIIEINALTNLNRILNGIDALIVVTDPQTYEILFINENMRQVFGVEADYSGLICYKALRNLEKRCDYCPCPQLDNDPDKEVIWEQKNEKLNRTYRSYSKYIKWPNGKNVHIQHAVDITEQMKMTHKLDRRLEQQLLMTRISQSFFSGEDLNTLMTKALREVGEFMGIAQILLYKVYDDELTIFCQSGWIDRKYNLPSRVGGTIVLSKDMLDIFRSLNNHDKFYITNDDPGVKETMRPYRKNFHNYLTTSIFIEGKLYAVLDFSRAEYAPWNQNQIQMASFTSNILTGVLQKHEMEERLIRAKESAEQSSRYKTDFLAKMSHEIRTPMNAIIGMTELALRENEQDPKNEHIVTVKQAASNLLEIINDILDFSKIEAGKMEIVPEKYSVTSLLNDIVSIIRMRVVGTKIRFAVMADSKIPNTLYGDDTKIRQALINILNNAVKYTENGFVSFSVHGNFTDDNTVMITFEVKDTGIGIKPEDINKLFDDFTQFDHEKNRNIEGVGLGLAITKNIIDTMGGKIRVQSEYGLGSTFTVALPQKYHSYRALAKIEVPEKKSVLIYERREIYIESLAYAINDLGAEYTVVSKGTDLYEKMESGKYDYLFISFKLYIKNEETILKLGKNTKTVILAAFGEDIPEKYSNVLVMPVYCTQIADLFNGVFSNLTHTENNKFTTKFCAPEAKVLVVDDINTNLKVAKGLLTPYKMHIDLCSSGKTAIEAVKNNRYDLVFMDHRMPVMDGVETTRYIRELDKDLPIIALTANAVSGMMEMFFKNGFNDFLSKPIDTVQLNEVLEKWIPKEKQVKK